MRFSSPESEDVNISLTPLVDVVFLLLIFFMVSTTFSNESQLRLQLPSSDRTSEPVPDKQQLIIDITQLGQYAIRRHSVDFSRSFQGDDARELSFILKEVAGDWRKPVVVIRADRRSSHESVMVALDAARQASLLNVTFSLQSKVEQ